MSETHVDTSSLLPSGAQPEEGSTEFSPVNNEPLLRWQRKIGLAPRQGLGVVRRAIILTLLAWLPLALWALFVGRFWHESSGESLLQHFAVNSRFLLAIPLLVIGEVLLHGTILQMTRQLVSGGFIADAQRADYRRILDSMKRWRDAAWPPLVIVVAVIVWTVLSTPHPSDDGTSWAVLGDGQLGFGGWWGAYVARPIFLLLLLVWCWRLLLVTVLFARIGRLDLQLIPSHPDHMGGLYFLDLLPKAWMLLTLTLSLVITSHWAHMVLYHGQSLISLKWQAAAFALIWVLLLLLPLFTLVPAMAKTKQKALLSYGDLMGQQGRMVHQRWIDRVPVEGDEELIEAPGLGVVADAGAIFETVKKMRLAPIGPRGLAFILLPLAIPMLVLVLLKVPLLQVIMKLFGAVL